MRAHECECVLFDLDGCLYPAGNGLEEHCRQRIYSFMTDVLGVEDVPLAQALWHTAFRRYNQSLRALRACGYKFDADQYWRYIREGSGAFLAPAPDTAALLQHLRAVGIRCWVVTNCREHEALEALAQLGIPLELFDGVLGADFMGDSCKPEHAAFAKVIAHTGCNPHRTVMFEDSLRNLVTAKALGIRCVLVGDTTVTEEATDPALAAADGVVDARITHCTLAHVQASAMSAALGL